MNNHQEETTHFEVTVTSDGVSTSGISGSPPIVIDTNNTLSWGINECSSSFQSVSSCETLESYEHTVANTESPKVIVVPFLAGNVTDNEVTGTVLANNGVHIPVIKECSIRIDQLRMSSVHCEETNIEKVIELPFNTNCTPATSPCCLTADDDSVFEGFGEESTIGTQYELYKKAVSLMRKNVERVQSVSERHLSEPILTERILTERHLTDRHPPDRNIKPDTVKRPRQVQRKISKQQLSDNQIEPTNQSRIENTEINMTASKQNSPTKPVPIPDRISSTPVESVDVKSNKQVSSSDSSDSVSDVTPAAVNNSATKKKLDRGADIKNNNKQKELKKLERMRRKKELSLVAERIRDHWRETFAAAKRKQRKKAKKSKLENNKHKTCCTKNDNNYQCRGQRKRKRVCYSSDSDSETDSSSKTSCSSSLSDSSSYGSETTRASDTSYTSQTSQTRTESDSTDSDSSDVHHRYRHRLNRCARSPSATSDTSDTSTSDDTFNKRRKLNFLKKAIHRKQSKSKTDENCPRPRKRKASESYQPEEDSLQNKKKMTKNVNRAAQNDSKRTKNRTIFSQKQQKFDFPSRSSSSSSAASAKLKKIKSEFAKRAEIESTSAGDFSVKQCSFD